MALTMLLMLKQFLKFTYAVSDVRLAQYLPDKAARRKQVCMRALSCFVGLHMHVCSNAIQASSQVSQPPGSAGIGQCFIQDLALVDVNVVLLVMATCSSSAGSCCKVAGSSVCGMTSRCKMPL